MDWEAYFDQKYGINEPIDLLEACKNEYRKCGYTEEKDFAGEYYFMFNPLSCQKVRLYYNGKIIEGGFYGH